MVVVVQGKLGSGKSYDCVRMMVQHILSGGAVRTNISLSIPQISAAFGRRLAPWQYGTLSERDDPALIPTGDRRGHGKRRTLVVLDEALNWFESSTAKDDTRRESWGRWLRQSDKLGQDVYFIAQNFERAAKWIRELAQVCIEMIPFRGMSWMGIPWGKLPMFRNVYSRRVWDVRSKSVLTWSLHKYSRFYWRFYDTSETFGFQGAASAYSLGVVYPAHVSTAPALACVFCVLLAWGIWFTLDY